MITVISDYEKEYGHLKGKKLLILGGVRMACDMVRRAQKMGVYTIVGDYLPDSPAKRIADKAVQLNAVNVEEIVAFCKKEQVDGITTGFVDILLQPCHDACQRLGLPYYAPDLLIEMSTNKDIYKRECRKFGVPVPMDYSINIDEDLQKTAMGIEYPVFIKPVDSSGSRGACVCYSAEEFLENYPKAMSFSPSKHVVVEEYLTGQDIILDYLLKDGEAHLLSMFDRKMCNDRAIAVNHANLLLSPSESVDQFVQEVDPKIRRMCKELGFRDGLIFFQGYSNHGRITLFEMGCRLGGTFSNIDEAFLGVNPVDALIHYALTGKMADEADYSKITPKFNGCGAVLNILMKEESGQVYSIRGTDFVRNLPQVVNYIQFFEEGDTVSNNNATDKPLLIAYLACKSREELKRILEQIYDAVDVRNKNGESMLKKVYKI